MIDIEATIQEAVKIAIREYDKEKKIENKRNVLHNTKLLMKHYTNLKSYSEKAIYKIEDIKELEELKDESDKIYITSIMRSRIRTVIMVSHIETALDQLKEKKKLEGKYEQYRALELFYIKKKKYEEIEEVFGCSKNTPGRWINEAIKDLSTFLFGLDALKIEGMV